MAGCQGDGASRSSAVTWHDTSGVTALDEVPYQLIGRSGAWAEVSMISRTTGAPSRQNARSTAAPTRTRRKQGRHQSWTNNYKTGTVKSISRRLYFAR